MINVSRTVVALSLTLAIGVVGCSKKEEPTPKAANPPTEAKAVEPPPASQPGNGGSGASLPAPGTQPAEPATAATTTAAEPPGATAGIGGPSLPPQPATQLAPVTNGYTTVYIEAWPNNARLQLKVNGQVTGVYDNHVTLSLDPILTPGTVNTIGFVFSKPGSEARLSVKAPGSDQWLMVMKFVSSKETLEDSFPVPFVGAKK